MPHDKNGKILSAGARVALFGTVLAVTSESPTFCNITFRPDEAMAPGEGPYDLALSARMVEQLPGSNGLNFSDALAALKTGSRVAREGWNGKGMWLRHYDPYLDPQFPIREIEPCEGTPLPWIGMKTADNKFVPWLASQTDILAEDWTILT